MPLDRESVTAASRIMLPTYVVLFTAIGINYTFNADRLQSSPGLAYADRWPPHLVGYGIVFLGCAALMAWALRSKERDVFRFALTLAQYCLYGWAAMFVLAAIFSDASPAGGVIWWALGRACKASNRSLILGEV